jgi:hypothetical protein
VSCFLEWCQQAFLDAVAYEAVCFFDLAIGLRMCDRRKLQFDAYTFTIILKFSGGEIDAIIRDYAVRDAEPKNYPFDEVYC